MEKNRWWTGDPTETFWIEFSDRQDVGVDLKAPETDESGKDYWGYSLFKEAASGDTVFHYHTPHDAIIGASRVAGPWVAKPILWGARGTFARAKGIKPHERPGYLIPLVDYMQLAAPLTLSALRADKQRLRDLVAALVVRHPKKPLYFPFELGAKRDLRPLQGYAFKLPRDFVLAFPELAIGDLIPTLSPYQQVPELQGVPTNLRPTSGGQGYGGSPELRRVVEACAMRAAQAFFESKGYSVDDVSRTQPFDLRANQGTAELSIEVKGTTTGADSVFLTRNEVKHAREHPTRAVLFVLHSIQLQVLEGKLVGLGGTPRVHWPWQVDAGKLEPLQFKYTPPTAD